MMLLSTNSIVNISFLMNKAGQWSLAPFYDACFAYNPNGKWTSCHQIPFHKKGKRIMFLKSEIDDWLHDGKMKSQKELEYEAEKFIKPKRKRHF